MVPTLLGITLMVFMLLALAPGGIGAGIQDFGGQGSQTGAGLKQAYLEDRYGLNDSVIVQYVRWLGRLSPVKFGTRDLRDGNGERVPAPRAIDEPLLAKAFPVPVVTVPSLVIAAGEGAIPQFKKLQREAEGTRRASLQGRYCRLCARRR